MSDFLENSNNEVKKVENKDKVNYESLSIFDKIINFITGLSDEERIKQKKLKEIARDLKSSRNKFYNYKKDIILPLLGKKFYELYRLLQYLAKYFDINAHKNSIKFTLFDLFIDKKVEKLKEQLEFNAINNLLKNSQNIKESVEKIKSILNEYIKSFTIEVVRRIDYTYNLIVDFSNLTRFDWLFLLKKFDTEITEVNFTYTPNFEPIEGKYIIEDLITLNDYLETIDFNKDWKYIFEYLKLISQDNNTINVMKKAIQICRELKKDGQLTKIIQLINKDPFFTPKNFASNTKIVNDYLVEFQRGVRDSIDKTLKEIKKEKIDALLLNIFQKTTIIRLKNYNEKLNDYLIKKGTMGLQYIEPLNYLKAFILDYCKGEIKSRIDELLIKGTWCTNTESSSYSSLLDHFNKISDMILEFDNSLSEDESYGKSIKKLTLSIKHDNLALSNLKKLIINIDNEAYSILVESIKILTYTANKLKLLIDDYNSKTPKIIIDFNKIKWSFSEDPGAELTRLYTKVVNFIALLKYFMKPQEASTASSNKE